MKRDSGVASYEALGHVPPSTSNNFTLVYFGVNLTANYPSNMCSVRDQLVQMSTTFLLFQAVD